MKKEPEAKKGPEKKQAAPVSVPEKPGAPKEPEKPGAFKGLKSLFGKK